MNLTHDENKRSDPPQSVLRHDENNSYVTIPHKENDSHVTLTFDENKPSDPPQSVLRHDENDSYVTIPHKENDSHVTLTFDENKRSDPPQSVVPAPSGLQELGILTKIHSHCPLCYEQFSPETIWKVNKAHISDCISRHYKIPETQSKPFSEMYDFCLKILEQIPISKKIKIIYKIKPKQFLEHFILLPELTWRLKALPKEKQALSLVLSVLGQFSPLFASIGTIQLSKISKVDPLLLIDLFIKVIDRFSENEDPQEEDSFSEEEVSELQKNLNLIQQLNEHKSGHLDILFEKDGMCFNHWKMREDSKFYDGSKSQPQKEVSIASVIQFISPYLNTLKSFRVRWWASHFTELKTIIRAAGNKNKFGLLSASLLASAMKDNNKLEHLDLEWNNIQDEGVSVLAYTFSTSSTLTYLDLGANNIGDNGAESLSKFLQTNKSLETLLLEFNNIQDIGLQHLVEGIKVHSSLKLVSVYGNSFEDETLKKLMQGEFGKKEDLLFYVNGMRYGMFNKTTRIQREIKIGRGVYEITAGKNDNTQSFAFKTFKSLTISQQYQLYNEFLYVKQISHPNVITVYGITDFKIDNIRYPGMIMEIADNTLEEYLKNSKLQFYEKWKLVFNILQGLVVIHKAEQVHCDLSLDNIFIFNGIPKIADFGITKKIGDPFISGIVTKTKYASPEISEKFNAGSDIFAYTFSDVYAFGIVACEILTQKPLEKCSPEFMKTMVVEMKKSGVDDRICYLVSSCLRELPEDRYSAEELLKLAEILDSELRMM